MSLREGRYLSLASPAVAGADVTTLRAQYSAALRAGLHGICFSAYEEGQKPGDQLTEEQIRRRMAILKPYTGWIRSFSTTEGNELIPRIAKEFGLKTMVGAWLSDNLETNENELDGLIRLANEGFVDVAAVGNEVLYREDLSEEDLLAYIRRAKASIHHVPVGYVDAYYEFEERPAIAEACDVILANCYPFWEGCDIHYSFMYMQEMYRKAQVAGGGKRVIITETGWPDKGTNIQGAYPSTENAMTYFINAQHWSKQAGIEMFYFSSFDESWKVGAEGDVGAFWGIWDKHEKLKFVD